MSWNDLQKDVRAKQILNVGPLWPAKCDVCIRLIRRLLCLPQECTYL